MRRAFITVVFFGVVTGLLSWHGAGSVAIAGDSPASKGAFKSEKIPLQLDYPDGWIVKSNESPEPEIPLILKLIPETSAGKHGGIFVTAFVNHMNVGDEALKALGNSYCEKVLKRSPDAKVSSTSDVKIGGVEAKAFRITDGAMQHEIRVLMHGEYGYTIGYVSPEKEFDETMFNKLLDSMKWAH